MIEKQELLRFLEEAYLYEESAVPIYTRHLESAVFWTGIKPESIKRMKDLLEKLAKDSERHKIIVQKLIADINRK